MQEEDKKEESSPTEVTEDKNTTETESESENTAENNAGESTEATQSETPTQSPAVAEAKADKETPKEEKKPSKAVSAKLEDIIKSIETMSVLELADLVKALEERFGVTAAAPMAMASAPTSGGGAPAEASEEQTSFTVILASGGANKIGAIKAVREIVPTLGLKEAKDLVDGAPKTIVEGVNKETANEAKTKLEAAGATVELK